MGTAVLFFLGGAMWSLIAMLFLFSAAWLYSLVSGSGGNTAMTSAIGFVTMIYVGIFALIASLDIWIGIALLKRQDWARITGMILAILGCCFWLYVTAMAGVNPVGIGLILFNGIPVFLTIANKFEPGGGGGRKQFAQARPARRRAGPSRDLANDYGADDGYEDDQGYGDEYADEGAGYDDYPPAHAAPPPVPQQQHQAPPDVPGRRRGTANMAAAAPGFDADAMTVPRSARGRTNAGAGAIPGFDQDAATMPRAGRSRNTQAVGGNMAMSGAISNAAPFALQTAQPGVQACPHCNGQIDVSGFAAGTVFACPHCQNTVQVS